MPELPEVESICRSLSHLQGEQIRSAWKSDKSLRYAISDEQIPRLAGERIVSVSRRGRFLLFGLERCGLGFHFGMSGWIRSEDLRTALPHDHFGLEFEKTFATYNDPRRFGGVFLCSSDFSDAAPLRNLGEEPLSPALTSTRFRKILGGSASPIKVALMDNALITGIGNIYASEILFMSGIHPETPASSISQASAAKMLDATRSILLRAIEQGGSTLKDFRHPDGSSGHAQEGHSVYGKPGQPCPVCQRPIESIRQGGRSTFFCGHCQRRPGCRPRK